MKNKKLSPSALTFFYSTLFFIFSFSSLRGQNVFLEKHKSAQQGGGSPIGTCNQMCNISPAAITLFAPCIADIDKHLARSLAMDGLVTSNTKWFGWNDNPPCSYNDLFVCSHDYSVCPYAQYCPTRYCEDIQLCVDLKAAFLRRAAGLWGSENWLIPGVPYYEAAKQLVIDVNSAYACQGVTPPIIQAAILENLTPNVNEIEIPDYVKAAFHNQMNALDLLHYYPTSGSVHFDFNRIRMWESVTYLNQFAHYYPDMIRIEARMLYYPLRAMCRDVLLMFCSICNRAVLSAFHL